MKLMVGFDGGEASKTALFIAIERARNCGARLLVVCARDRRIDADPAFEQRRRHDLAYAATLAADAGVGCETHLLAGGSDEADDLVRFAEANGVDEIVIGIKKRSRVEKILLGSTAQYVILKAPCPVLTVK